MSSTPPPLPDVSGTLDIEGFTLGHGTDVDFFTGVTVILVPEGAVAGAEVRGSATGTRQFDSLVLAHHVATRAHAVVLSGGSGFGLAAADPVVAHLRQAGHGFDTGVGVVPLVPTAIIFDLAFGSAERRPWPELARKALESAASGVIECGSVGVGTGATVGKARGFECGMKGGFGFASLEVPAGPKVAAAVALNALGDVLDSGGRLLAGARVDPASHELAGSSRTLVDLPPDAAHPWEGNTTLAVVMTDADLSKSATLKVSQMAFGALYRRLDPALSVFDGDLVVTLASGKIPAHVNQVGILAARAVSEAILCAVREADGFGILPALRDITS